MKPRSPLRRISAKQLAKRGGKVFSTIAPKEPVAGGKPYIRGGNQKKIRSVNPEQAARRKARSKKHHAAYMRSETRKMVEARSGGVCERQTCYRTEYRDSCGYPRIDVQFVRCHEPATDHHHKTYARYGGKELPEDMLHVCKRCHEWLDKDKPSHHRRGS